MMKCRFQNSAVVICVYPNSFKLVVLKNKTEFDKLVAETSDPNNKPK